MYFLMHNTQYYGNILFRWAQAPWKFFLILTNFFQSGNKEKKVCKLAVWQFLSYVICYSHFICTVGLKELMQLWIVCWPLMFASLSFVSVVCTLFLDTWLISVMWHIVHICTAYKIEVALTCIMKLAAIFIFAHLVCLKIIPCSLATSFHIYVTMCHIAAKLN